jgi:acetolactate synthase I/II/III large subunit
MGAVCSVARLMIRMLEERGIDRIFGIPGGPISPLFDACLDTNIEIVPCQHETMAVYAARGYARATGRPAVVMVTSGPGILNAVTGIAAAFQNEAPVIVIAGDVATTSAGRGVLQDGGPAGLDILGMLRRITKRSDVLHRPSRAAPLLDEALTAAMSFPRGPVFLSIPVDIARAPAIHTQSCSAPVSLGAPSPDVCAQIAGRLSRANRPVLFAGLGARNAEAGSLLLEIAEAIGCPIITDVEGKGVIPESHPLALGVFGVGGRGVAASYLERERPDVILGVGARFDDTTTSNYSLLLEGDRTFIQVDYDPRRLGRGYPVTQVVASDIRLALEGIHRELPRASPAELQARKSELADLQVVNSRVEARLGAPPHNPRAVAAVLRRCFGPDTVFTSDIGNHLLFTAESLELELPDTFHVDVGLGGMGSGLGTAIGLQLGYGTSRQVVCVMGDGCLLMTGNEISTCVQQKIPLLIAVFNDGQLGMVRHGDERVFGRARSHSTPRINIADYARALGARGVYVENDAALKSALAERPVGPLVLDIPIDPEVRALNPRESALNFPAREETHDVDTTSSGGSRSRRIPSPTDQNQRVVAERRHRDVAQAGRK